MSTVQDTSAAASLFGTGTTTTTKSGISETEDRFLTLLVAQMKNQDPLNPLDNAEVTSQMAQLSTVQGIESMNKTLESLAASMGVNQMAQAANLIGHAVLVPGDTVGPAELENIVGFELAGPADKVTVEIYDSEGVRVRSLDLGPRESGVNMIAWDGLLQDGSAAPDAAYTFEISAVRGGAAVSHTALNLGMVNSVSQTSQGVQLNLAADRSAGYSDVRQIF
jgi:flagellar basal-body rod modification protein FlgD